MNVSIIILAAGKSERMGVPKQLLLLEGKTLIKRIIDIALDTPCYPIVAVLGANKALIKKELAKMPITIIDNNQFENGMSSSIKIGLAGAYMTQKEIEAVIFLTVDMPLVSKNLIDEMLKTAIENEDKQVVACQYDNTEVGIPVLFKRSLFNELLELSGDEGAKKILLKHQKDTVFVNFPEGKIDLDTIEEYRHFISNHQPN